MPLASIELINGGSLWIVSIDQNFSLVDNLTSLSSMATQCMMDVPTNLLRLMLNPSTSFLQELCISPIKNFFQAIHDVLELSAIVAHELRLTASTPMLSYVPVVVVMMGESLLASCTFPIVG